MLLTSLKSESAWLILVLLLLSLNAAAQTPSFLLTPANPGGLTSAIADFNGDGRLDIATHSDLSAGVTILLGNGDGTFRHGAKVNNPIPNPIYSILTADFNGDGKPDLLISGTTAIARCRTENDPLGRKIFCLHPLKSDLDWLRRSLLLMPFAAQTQYRRFCRHSGGPLSRAELT